MAASVGTHVEETSTICQTTIEEDLMSCGSCHRLLQEPRTLSCLHSFCLACLKARTQPEGATSLSCPTCSTETQIPAAGVIGLSVNAFVSRLRNETLMREELADEESKIECTACDGTAAEASSSSETKLSSSQAVSRCFECDDYLCERCTNVHKILRSLKQHPLFTLDELRSGKVPLSLPDQNMCTKHKGELLVFYCETCDVPICSKCAVVAHCRPEHKQVELDSAAAERSKQIQKLEAESAQIANKVDELILLNEELEKKLKKASSTARDELEKANNTAKSHLLENLEKTRKASEETLKLVEEEKMKVIRKNLNELKSARSRLSTSRKIAKDVTQKGSEFEIAAVYSNVTSSLKDLCEWKPCIPAAALGKVSFDANKNFLCRPTPGKLGQVNAFQRQLNRVNKLKEFGALTSIRGITFTTEERIIVSINSKCDAYVYDKEGNKKFEFCNSSGTDSGWTSRAWCVVNNPDGGFFGTDNTQYVKQYDAKKGTYLERYTVSSPENTQSGPEGSKVQGLALDKNGHLLVGNVTKNYVSIIKTDGTHISSMHVPIQPWFISATPTDSIIVSSYTDKAVHIIDHTGKILLTLSPPAGVSNESWNPTGVCCSKDGDVYVANHKGQVGIYQYTLDDGICIGCNIHEEVQQPWGLALSRDEKKLAVADHSCVKVFEIKYPEHVEDV